MCRDKIDNFTKYAILHGEGSVSLDVAQTNGAAEEIYRIVTFLRNENCLKLLKPLLLHENFSVVAWAASYLLEQYENDSIKALNKVIESGNSDVSFDAEIVLEEWRKGTFKAYYKEGL